MTGSTIDFLILRENRIMVVADPLRASLTEVSVHAGVSVSTASRVLTGRGDFSHDTRRRVFEAAAALGYDRGSTKRGRPASADTQIVEIVIGRLAGAWVSRAVAGAHERAFALGYDLVLTRERDVPADDWHVRVAARRSSGVITAVVTPTSRQVDYLTELAIPTVLLDPQGDPGRDLVTVTSTNRRGGFDAGQHLVAMGYERFVLGAAPLRYRYGRARERGFRDAVEIERPQEGVSVVEVGWDGRIPRATIDRLADLAAESRVGVFTLNDRMANALVAGLLDAGVSVPGRVGIVGFDDDPRPAGAPLALTSVRQPIREMAARAVESIDALRRGDEISERHIELATELVARSSTSR